MDGPALRSDFRFPPLRSRCVESPRYGGRVRGGGFCLGYRRMKSKLPVPTAKDINEAHRLARKQAWIAEARKSFRPGERCWCGICDGYEDIAHAHHVLPLSRQFDLGVA